MKCEDVQARLPLLALGELNPRDSDGMRDHLAGCARCRAAQEELGELMSDLAGGPELTDLERLKLENDVLRRLAVDPALATRRLVHSRSARVLLRLAAGIMLFAAGYLAQQALRPGPGTPARPASALAVREWRYREWSGQRLSGAGLHVIAHGKAAVPAVGEPGI